MAWYVVKLNFLVHLKCAA